MTPWFTSVYIWILSFALDCYLMLPKCGVVGVAGTTIIARIGFQEQAYQNLGITVTSEHLRSQGPWNYVRI